MKLALYQKAFIYQHLALGTRKCVIVDKVNKEWGTETSEFKKNHMAFYTNKWKDMTPDERRLHLPYSMEESFATQEVRINDDIHQLKLINSLIYSAETSDDDKEPSEKKGIDIDAITNLEGVAIRLKNRIAQELGQAKAFNKGGVGNLNQLNQLQIQFNTLVNEGSKKTPQEQVKYLEGLFKLGETVDADKPDK